MNKVGPPSDVGRASESACAQHHQFRNKCANLRYTWHQMTLCLSNPQHVAIRTNFACTEGAAPVSSSIVHPKPRCNRLIMRVNARAARLGMLTHRFPGQNTCPCRSSVNLVSIDFVHQLILEVHNIQERNRCHTSSLRLHWTVWSRDPGSSQGTTQLGKPTWQPM